LLSLGSKKLSLLFAILEEYGIDDDEMLDEEPAMLESFVPSVGELSLQDVSANTANPRPRYFIFTLTFDFTKIYNQLTHFPVTFLNANDSHHMNCEANDPIYRDRKGMETPPGSDMKLCPTSWNCLTELG
jgi:hypothetical protein